MPDILSFLLWYLAVLVLGLAAWPLAYPMLRYLPGRGWALSKALGLLLAGYVFWFLGSLGFLTNSVGSILLSIAIVAGLSIWSIRKSGFVEIRQFLTRNSQFLVLSEVLFLAAFGLWAFVRAHNPEIVGTEKPMEFAFLNAINRSAVFPPLDPWLSDYAISYYYFGYVIVMMLARLAGTAPGVAFNLGGSLLFGLVAVASWGIVCDLIEAERRTDGTKGTKGTEEIVSSSPGSSNSFSSFISPSSFYPALLGPLFVLSIGNFGGFLEVLHSRHVFWDQAPPAQASNAQAPDQPSPIPSFWAWIDLEDLDQPPSNPPTWVPDRYLWWWRSSRVIRDRDLSPSTSPTGWQFTPTVKFLGQEGRPIDLQPIDEFPMFSFLLGDLHPHVLALPFVLLAIGLALNLILRPWPEAGLTGRAPAPAAEQVAAEPDDARPNSQFAIPLRPDGPPPPWEQPTARLSETIASATALASVASVAGVPGKAWGNLQFLSAFGLADFALYAVVLGALSFLNTWDFPIYLAVAVGAYALARSTREGWKWGVLRDAAMFGAGLLLAGILLYLPFYIGFQTQAGGLLPNFIFPTRLPQFIIMFGPLLTVVLIFVAWLAVRHPAARQANWSMLPLTALVVLGPLLLLTAALGLRVLAQPELLSYVNDFLAPISLEAGLRLAIVRRLTNPWTALLLLLVVGIAASFLNPRRQSPITHHQSPALPASNKQSRLRGAPTPASPTPDLPRSAGKSPQPLSPALTLVLLLTTVGALLTLFPEFLYLKDNFGARMNTIFKFYYQAWLQWGLVAAFAVWYLNRHLRAAGRVVFQAAVVVAILAGLIYPVLGVWNKAGGFLRPGTLDGFAYMASSNLSDYNAIRWLNQNVPGSPVIAEAIGGQYSEFGRVSASTGLPTVMGWPGHEGQWRGNLFGQQAGARESDIESLYRTRSWEDADAILKRYDIRYVYLGAAEAAKYGLAGAGKFNEFMTPVYQDGGVSIFQRVDLSP